MLLNDKVEPSDVKSITDSAEPIRENDLREMQDPRSTKSSTDKEDLVASSNRLSTFFCPLSSS
jgi:hypothetical protein